MKPPLNVIIKKSLYIICRKANQLILRIITLNQVAITVLSADTIIFLITLI